MDEVYQLTQDGVSRLEQPLPGQPGALCLLRCHSPVLEQRAGSADSWREGSGRTCLSGLLCAAPKPSGSSQGSQQQPREGMWLLQVTLSGSDLFSCFVPF